MKNYLVNFTYMDVAQGPVMYHNVQREATRVFSVKSDRFDKAAVQEIYDKILAMIKQTDPTIINIHNVIKLDDEVESNKKQVNG